MRKSKVKIPENYDPYDVELKKLFHQKADKLNYIGQPRGLPKLLCGAMKGGKPCKQIAGSGTRHTGYGRCSRHGGASTGPKTPEGKAKASRNREKHGFFSKALTEGEYNFFIQFISTEISLEPEISYWRSKIVSYLMQNHAKWKQAFEEKKALGEVAAGEYADRQTRKIEYVFNGSNKTTSFRSYHIATVEDKVLLQALDILGRLIEVQAKLNPKDDAKVGSLIEQINQELQIASFGQVSVSLNAELL